MIATESTEDTERKNSVLSVSSVAKKAEIFSLVVFCTATFDVMK
jgi:TctA family transporter